MAIMPLDKPIDEVIETMKRYVKEPIVEQEADAPLPTWTITGEFKTFDRWEMDMWGGRMQFRVVDTRPQDAEEEAQRRETSGWVPQLAGLLNATTTMQVFKEVQRTTKTVVIEDGKEVSATETATEAAWKDITREFAGRGQRDRLMREEW